MKPSCPSLLSPSWCGQREQVTGTCVPAPWPPPQRPPQWCEERVGGRRGGGRGDINLLQLQAVVPACRAWSWVLPSLTTWMPQTRVLPAGTRVSNIPLASPEGSRWQGALLLLSVTIIYCLFSAEQSLRHKKAQ